VWLWEGDGMSTAQLETWSATAVNLPEHGHNPIHTDDGARAAGFPAALVAGVSSYAYMTHVPVCGWGLEWIASGGAEVRFHAPVFDGDAITVAPSRNDDGDAVTLLTEGGDRVSARVWTGGAAATAPRDGESLPSVRRTLGTAWADLGRRLGDDLPLYGAEGIVHPAAWPSIANDIVHTNLVTGSWIHTRSHIQHHNTVRVGSEVHVESVVFDRFDSRMGGRAVLDVSITCDGEPVATIEHEAIVSVAS